MKRILLICCFAMAALLLNAQKIYFVYLQTETGEPFFIRMDDKLYSSAASGYLILPRLKDSTYHFKLGFPGKNVDLDFSTSINKKDHGYLVKNFGDKGWGLFDLQSLSIQMSSSNVKGTSQLNNSSGTQVNAFTDLLAKAADDPSLKQNPILVKEEEKKPEVVEAVVKEEKKPEVTEAISKEEKKPEAINKPEEKKTEPENTINQKNESGETSVVKTEEVYKRSQIVKVSGAAIADGIESVYIDQYQDGKRDTVRILIPSDTKIAVIKEEPTPEIKKEDKKFLEITTDTAQAVNKSRPEIKKEGTKKPGLFTKTKLALFNKNKNATPETKKCQSFAGSDDFLKLRRKMAAKTNDDGMIEEAKKYFKIKCFTTVQIKNLSSMFLSNAGKYNFFEAAYNYTSDKENFSSLQSELKDEYYINRLKDLLHN
jgi:hypothetical protein